MLKEWSILVNTGFIIFLQGGIKAVVWTDVVQTVSMFACILIVIFKGTLNVGGPGIVFARNLETGRISAPV